MSEARSSVDPRGPVFVSSRQSDGRKHVARLAWLLRAAGVPVWHDASDLPPGDTTERLEQALSMGLSGGVLLVTEKIKRSGVVRNTELPLLLDLEKVPNFVLAVGTVIRDADGRLDYSAADSLLGQPTGTIARLKQHAADSRGGLIGIVREIWLASFGRSFCTEANVWQRLAFSDGLDAGRGRRGGSGPEHQRHGRTDAERGPRQHHALLADETPGSPRPVSTGSTRVASGTPRASPSRLP